MATDPGHEPAEQFARLPLLTQRALVCLALSVVDSTEDEKELLGGVFVLVQRNDELPAKVREVVGQLRSLVSAVEHQVAMNQMDRYVADGGGA